MITLLDQVLDRIGPARPDSRGWQHIPCPFCGAKANRYKPNFSLRLTDAGLGFNCFSCGARGGLVALAEQLGMGRDPYLAPMPAPRPTPRPAVVAPPAWLADAEKLVSRYAAHPDTIRAWQAYKPLSPDTIRSYRLGYGCAPTRYYGQAGRAQFHPRPGLILPVVEQGQIVGLRVRSPEGWLTVAGSKTTLFGLGELEAGAVAVIGENNVDSLLVMQEWPGVVGLSSTTGVRTWRWGAEVAERRPSLVIVATDNDLSGQAEGERAAILRAAWQAKHPTGQHPDPMGPRIVADLHKHGVRALLYHWPIQAPKDVGGLVMGGADLYYSMLEKQAMGEVM